MTKKSLYTHFSRTKLPFFAPLARKLPASAEVFVVGGAVRDALLGRTTKDIDLVVRNTASRTLERILRSFGPVELVGKTFGVYKWSPKRWKGEQVDVALPRKDHAFGTGGYKDVNVQSDPKLPLKEDLIRRDFTINALAFDLKKKTLIDYAGGLSDLASKTVRTVGDPVIRFREDFSRMLRGLRFATSLGFSLDGRTAKIIRIMMYRLNDKTMKGEWVVPRETIAHELIRMFAADPVRAFDHCYYEQVFDVLMPEVMDMQGCQQPVQYHVEGDVMQHTRTAIENLQSPQFKKLFGNEPPSALLVFGVLLHDVGKPRTITFPETGSTDRIRYNNHDSVGAEIAHRIASSLHLSVFSKDDMLHHIDADDLAWLVRNHLVGFRNVIEHMRPATIEKYFFHQFRPSDDLLKMQFVDSVATIGPTGKADMSGFRKIYQTVQKMAKTRKQSGARPLLSGYDIMRELQISSGPAVGRILESLRDAQLQRKIQTKDAAKLFIRKLI